MKHSVGMDTIPTTELDPLIEDYKKKELNLRRELKESHFTKESYRQEKESLRKTYEDLRREFEEYKKPPR